MRHFFLTSPSLAISCPCWWESWELPSRLIFFSGRRPQEVEEERSHGLTLHKRKGATSEELALRRTDVATGMLFSNAIMYFIILTTAATLHAHGKTNIASAKEAAEALLPLGR